MVLDEWLCVLGVSVSVCVQMSVVAMYLCGLVAMALVVWWSGVQVGEAFYGLPITSGAFLLVSGPVLWVTFFS
jgi:hypothetical protein